MPVIRLSIIIPVYNVKAYIARCLDSCLHQDISADEYEIVVVNDGTPDNSMDIVREYAGKYHNIVIAERPNGGLSAARNTGLKAARGQYVWFVDSDDYIEPDCTGRLLDQCQRDNLDVLCFNLNIVYEDGHIKPFVIGCWTPNIVCDGHTFIDSVYMPPAAWVAIYRRSFLIDNCLRFYEGILHEDQEYTPRAYTLASRISYTDLRLYNYYQRTGSIMKSSQDVRRSRDLLTVADSLYNFATTHCEAGSKAYRALLFKVHFCFMQSLAYHSRQAIPLKEYRQRPYYPLDTSLYSGTTRIKVTLANTSLCLYKLIRRLK